MFRVFAPRRFVGFLCLLLIGLACVLTAPTPAHATRWALLVGIDDYDDDRISDLEVCSKDVEAVSDLLGTRGGFAVTLMTSPLGAPSRNRPTRLRLEQQFKELEPVMNWCSKQAVSWGHGLPTSPTA